VSGQLLFFEDPYLCEQTMRLAHGCPDRNLALPNGIDQHATEDLVDFSLLDVTKLRFWTCITDKCHVKHAWIFEGQCSASEYA